MRLFRFFFLFWFTTQLFGLESQLAFVVNNRPVLLSELQQRLQFTLLMMGSDINDTAMKNKLKPLVINRWTDEQLTRRSSLSAGIKIDCNGAEIQQAITNMAQNNNMTRLKLRLFSNKTAYHLHGLSAKLQSK